MQMRAVYREAEERFDNVQDEIRASGTETLWDKVDKHLLRDSARMSLAGLLARTGTHPTLENVLSRVGHDIVPGILFPNQSEG